MLNYNDPISIKETLDEIVDCVVENLFENTKKMINERKGNMYELISRIEKEDSIELKKEFSYEVLCIYTDLVTLFNSYASESLKIKDILKRIKVDGTNQKLIESLKTLDNRSIDKLIKSANNIHFTLPKTVIDKDAESIVSIKSELYVCKTAASALIERMKDLRKDRFGKMDTVEEIKRALQKEGYFAIEQKEYESLMDKTVIYEILMEFAEGKGNLSLEEADKVTDKYQDYFIEALSALEEEYEKHETELEEKAKELRKLRREQRQNAFEKLKITKKKEIDEKLDQEEIEDIDIHAVKEVNEWLSHLQDGLEFSSILSILKDKNNEKLNAQFYDSLQEEIYFLNNELLLQADSKEEKIKVENEIEKYENYVHELEDYFSDEEEPLDVETNRNLIFATTSNQNFYFDTSLSNIQDRFHKKELIKAMNVLKKGSKDTVRSHTKPLTRQKQLQGLYEYKTYDVRILYRVLDENNYYIINSFVKKWHMTNGYRGFLTNSYSKTNNQYEEYKRILKEEGFSKELLDYQEKAFDEINQVAIDLGTK